MKDKKIEQGNTYRAISYLMTQNIILSRGAFDKYLKEYNDYRGPLRHLIARIATGKEEEFVNFVRQKELENE